MNKNLFWVALIAATTMTFGLTSCSESYEEPNVSPIPKVNEEVAGFYHGGIYANFVYMQKFQPEADQTITITADKNSETVTISYLSATWGEFLYENVEVTKNEDGSYQLEGKGNCAMASMHTDKVTDYSTIFKGTITDGKLVAELIIPSVMGGTTIMFNPNDIEEVLSNVKIEEIVGTYTGGIYTNFEYMQKFQPEANQIIIVTANADNKTVTVRYFSATWGEFLYENVAVSKDEEGSYLLAGEGICTMKNQHSDSAEMNSYQTMFTGTITDGVLAASLNIPELMKGTTIMFNPEDIDEVLGNGQAE